MKYILTILALALGATALSTAAEPEIRRLPESVHAKARFLNRDHVFIAHKAGGDAIRPDAKPLPLLVYLHGAGGRGDDVAKAKNNVARVMKGLAEHVDEPCLVVAPQCSKGTLEDMGIWQPKDLDLLLAHLKKTLPVDVKRVYLSGNSMGGFGCWAWAGESPERFAAVAPVVGGLGFGGPKDVSPDLDRWAKNLKNVPVWAFHGATDRVVPAERSERMVKLIREKGGKNAKLTIYPDEGHGAGRKAFFSAEFYKWMFGQRRD
jgi:predicted peptidase